MTSVLYIQLEMYVTCLLHACYMRTSACYTSSKHTPTAHTPTVRTEQRGQLGDESGLDHLASEAGVEGEVEEETKGGALELLEIGRAHV